MLAIALVLKEPWIGKEAIQRSSVTSWAGGLFGAVYIAISILLFQRLGAAVLIALIVAGQMAGSLALDHFGLLGVPLHPVTPSRLVRAALLVTGVIFVRA